MKKQGLAVAAALMIAGAPAVAQQSEVEALRQELARTKAELERTNAEMKRQEARLRAIEAQLGPAPAATAAVAAAAPPPRPPVVAAVPPSGIAMIPPPGRDAAPAGPRPEQVGQAPAPADRPPEVAALADQGSIVTRLGQLTAEFQLDYARSDRTRAVARGVSLAEVINIGIFNLNESGQDAVSASGQLRYGVTDNIEAGVRLPFVYRTESLVLSPLPGDDQQEVRTISTSADAAGIGDVEFTARYQFSSARGGWPFLIANVQVAAPTGTDPFEIDRLEDGTPTETATGAGFWAVSPSVTAILPSDPVVLFGSIGYGFNLSRKLDTTIAGTLLRELDPGDSLSFSAGLAVALNQRVTLSLGYAHNWVFGTFTRQRTGLGTTTDPFVEATATSRDLQIGRLLIGTTYRTSDYSSINWTLEMGATDDATDLRTTIRVPFTLLAGGR